MFQVTNISERSIIIGGKRIKPLQIAVFDENTISVTAKRRIDTLSNLGLISIMGIQQTIQPSIIDDNKKQFKKTK